MGSAPGKTKLTPAKAGPTLADAAPQVWHKTPIKMYAVSEESLRELTAGYNSLHLVFFGIFFGCFVSCLIAYTQTSEQVLRGRYFFAFLATALVSFFFAVSAGISLWKAHSCKKRLVKQSVPIEP